MNNLTHFQPSKIYCLEDVKNNPISIRILNHPTFSQVPKMYVNKQGELKANEYISNVSGIGFYRDTATNHDRGRSILAIKPGPGQLVVEEHRTTDVVSMDVCRRNNGKIFDVKLGSNCTFRCHYCYLYGANNNNPEVAVYVDTNKMKEQMKKAVNGANGAPVLFNAGEHTDSLALDPITKITSELVPFIPTLNNTMMELRTKSANVDNLDSLAHQEKTIVAWSVAPQAVIDQTEFDNAVSYADRLDAMIKVQQWGYPIALKLDPIVPVDFYLDHYKAMIQELSLKLDPGLIHHFAVGVLRMSGKLKKIIEEMYPGDFVNTLSYPCIHHGKYTHSLTQRTSIYKEIIPLMRAAFPTLQYYISMEDKTVANGIMSQLP